MCGIAGAIGAIDPTIERAVGAMMDAEVHRGPDDSGTYRTGGSRGVIFGFRRLAILDLTSDGHQPMVDPRSGSAIVFNGEIYNYLALKRELEGAGTTFRSKSDTEVLLQGFAHWGNGVLGKLRGMYGFAAYDPASRQVLLARDRLGIKPLYYAEVQRPDGKVLLFASELRAVLATGLIPRHLDPDGLATYLWNGFVIGPATAVRGVSLLPPGGWMTVSIDHPTAKPARYWSMGPRSPLPEAQAVAKLEHELLTAVRQHLASDVPLGVFLSGGVDSSAVASLAVRAGSRNVKTFHIGFDEAGFDESSYARRVSNALSTEHAEYRLTQARFVDDLENALSSIDQPTFDGINNYFVSRVVRDAGFTVALAGTGGDELFGGYKSFRDLPRSRGFVKALGLLPAALLDEVSRFAVRLKFGRAGEVPPQVRWGKLRDVLSTSGDLLSMYQVSYGLYTREFLAEMADPRVLGRAPEGLPPALYEALASTSRRTTALSAISVFELSLFIGERLLRDTDWASMAPSLEVRVPLLDHEVVEAVQRVPDAARFLPLGSKALLRKLAMPTLDPTIFDRPKAGFVLPIEVWAKDRLAPQLESLFADRVLLESVGLEPAAVQRLWRTFRSGAPGIYWSRIWAPFVLLHWCQKHRVELG